jgi:integrase
MLPTTYIPTPDLTPIDRLDRAESYKAKLRSAITRLAVAGVNPFNANALRDYADTLPISGRMFLKAGLRIMYADRVSRIKTAIHPAQATPENVAKAQAALWQLEEMDNVLTTHQPDRERLPHWLTQAQVDNITSLAYRSGLRDYIVLAILLGAGLRREELTRLTFDSLSTVDGKPVITLRGKGSKVRTVPITPVLYRHLMEWRAQVGSCRIARSIHKTGKIGSSLSPTAIFDIVRRYGSLIGIADLDPHDLRRTFGRLVYQSTGDILRVMHLLGHSKVETTQRYIGLEIDLEPVNIIRNDFVSVFGD